MGKRFFAVKTAALAGLLSFAAVHGALAANPKNLITNGSFEETFDGVNYIPRGETKGGWYANWASATRKEGEGFGGSYGVYIADRSANYQGLEQPVDLKKGIEYKFSIKLRLPDGAEEKRMKLVIPSESYKEICTVTLKSGEWVEATGKYTPLEDKTGFKLMLMDASTPVLSAYYMDDYIVTSEYINDCVISISGDEIVKMPLSGDLTMDYTKSVKYKGADAPEGYDVSWSVDEEAESAGVSIEDGTLNVPEGFVTEESGEKTVYVSVEATDFGASKKQTKAVIIEPFSAQEITDPAANLCINGSFESDLGALGETWEGWWSPGTVTRVMSNESIAARRGSYYLKISGRNANSMSVMQRVNLKKGIPYKFSFYIRLPDGDADHTMNIVLPSESYRRLGSVSAKSGQWTRAEVKYIPSSELTGFRFMIIDASGVQNTFYLDEYTVTSNYIKDCTVDILGADSAIMPQSGAKSENYSVNVRYENSDITDFTAQWSVDEGAANAGVSIENGVLNIPEGFVTEESGEKTITLTVKVTDLGTAKTQTKEITVTPYISPQSIVEKEIAALLNTDVTDESLEAITKNLSLRTVGRYGAVIEWQSSDETIIKNDGTLLASDAQVHRVTLTATAKYDGASASKTFNLITSARDELIINGDFEQSFEGSDTIEKGKTKGSWFANWAEVRRMPGEGKDNSYGVYISGRSGRYQGIQQTVRLKKGRKYTISADLRLPDGRENHTFMLSSDANGTKLAEVTAKSGEWVTLSHTKICNADEDFTFWIFDSGNSVEPAYYIDNVTITFNSLNRVEIKCPDSFRKPQSGTKRVKLSAISYDRSESVVSAGVEWFAENAPHGVAVDGEFLTIDENADTGDFTLLAVAEYDGIVKSARKTVTIGEYLNEEAIVNTAAGQITWQSISDEAQTSVTKNLKPLANDVPVTYENAAYSVNVLWSSTDTSVISNTGEVTQNAFENKNARLTATLTLGEITKEISFDITVLKLSNLADNPGFEVSNQKWTGGTVTSEKSHGGANSYAVSAEALLENDYIRQDHIYHLSGYVMKENGGILNVVQTQNGEKIISDKSVAPSVWTLFNGDFARPGSGTFTFSFKMNGSFYLDDVVITDITDIYNDALTKCTEAETGRTAALIAQAREAAALLPECPRKDALILRINAITVYTPPQGGGGGGGGSTSYSPSIVKNDDINSAKTAFSDVKGHWAEEDISYLYNKGIVNGKTKELFEPESSVTRAELVALLVRSARQSGEADYSFKDTAPDAWYTGALKAAVKNGIVQNGESFRPNDSVTREEMAAMLMRTYRASGKSAAAESAGFNDDENISAWAAEDVKAAAGLKLLNGMPDGTFCPKETLTRAQAAAVIRRMYDLVTE